MTGAVLVVGAFAPTDAPTYVERLNLILEPIEPCRLVDTFEPFRLMHEQPCGEKTNDNDETDAGGGGRDGIVWRTRCHAHERKRVTR